jgi:GDP-mannose 6-dehydrogenase
MGHEVCGVDVSAIKVRMLNEGRAPVLEKGLERLVAGGVRQGVLRASLEPAEAMRGADVSLICVGTPSRRNGEANIDPVLHAASEIGLALRLTRHPHAVVVRSTVPPGTVQGRVIPVLERSSRKKAGRDFTVCFHPEFLREGSSIKDFFQPPMTLLGVYGVRGPKRLLELWRPIKAPLWVTPLGVAEMIKYADNAFHALKISFANEIGVLAKSLGIDGHEVMRILVQDKKLNISPVYLQPGFAFGGPCLPKDLRALCWMGRRAKLDLPLLSDILKSNTRHLQRARDLVLGAGKKRVGILGLAFKPGTDDLRESPACALVRALLRAKRAVSIFDPRVDPSRLTGANRAFIEKELPELPQLLTASLQELLAASEVVVVAGTHPEFGRVVQYLKARHTLIDLVGHASIAPGVASCRLC